MIDLMQESIINSNKARDLIKSGEINKAWDLVKNDPYLNTRDKEKYVNWAISTEK